MSDVEPRPLDEDLDAVHALRVAPEQERFVVVVAAGRAGGSGRFVRSGPATGEGSRAEGCRGRGFGSSVRPSGEVGAAR